MAQQLPLSGLAPARPPALPAQDQPAFRLRHLGAGALSSVEILSLQLSGPAPVALASRLVSEYGSLYDVARAPVEELQRDHGVGPASATRIRAAAEFGVRAQAPRPELPQIRTPADAANLVMAEMQVLEQEEIRVLLLDARSRVTATLTIYRGSNQTVLVRIGELFRDAIRRGASKIVVAHNHPSGDPTPSPEDVALTKQLVEAGQLLDIDVLDHIIIGHQRWVSLKERGLGF